jgi:hypothetical protein
MNAWLILVGVVLVIGQAVLFLMLGIIVRRIDRIEFAGAGPGCSHAEVKNVGTFGHPEYLCQLCHQVVDLP